MRTRSILLALALALSASGSAQATGWSPAGDLVVGVDSNNAFTLSDGRVVSVGIPQYIAWWTPTTQFWKPSSNAWKAVRGTAPLTGIVQPVPVMLDDGRVLVTGLCHSNCGRKSNTEIYDPAAKKWSLPRQMTVARYQHAAIKLSDGRVLVAGGCIAYGCAADTDSVEIFDPPTNRFAKAAPMKIHRADFTATLLDDGRVLVAGGYNSTGALAESEIFDPPNNTWTVTRKMKTAHAVHVAALLQDGRVLVAGGDEGLGLPQGDAEVFDPATGNWTAAGAMADGREYSAAVTLKNGNVLVAGGFSVKGESFVTLSAAELFDPVQNKFVKTVSMAHEREQFSMTMLLDGRVMAVGGDAYLNGELKVPGDAEIFTP